MQTGHVFHNWDRTLECTPRRYFQPHCEAEVIQVVRAANAANETVRVVGAGHSWSPLVLTQDNLLNLDHLNQLVSIDADKMQVTVGAGIRLKHLNELLAQHGLALANLGSVAEQSVAGAISTGTHGTGVRYGNLSTQIVALNFVTGDGRLMHIAAERDAELMRAARVSLGALGVITQVTIQCVKAHRIELRSDVQPFEHVLDRMEQLVNDNDRVRMYWYPGTDVFYINTLNQTNEPLTPHQPIKEWLNNVAIRHDLMEFFLKSGSAFPALVNPINRMQAAIGFTRERRVARSDLALTIPMPAAHQETEYAVPIEHTVRAIRATRELIERNNYRANVPVEVRFVAHDDSMLSPAYGRDVAYIGAYTYGQRFARDYFAAFERAMKELGGRPHWGKILTLKLGEARAMYPLYNRFNQIRQELDPGNTFANQFIRELFG